MEKRSECSAVETRQPFTVWTAASRCHTGSWEARQAPNAKLLREQRWLLVVHSCIGQRGLWETSETLESILIESRTLIETDGVRAGSRLRQGQISSVLVYIDGAGTYLWVMRDGNQKPTGCVDTPVLSKNAVLDPENRQSTPKARCTPHITTQEKQRFQLPTFR